MLQYILQIVLFQLVFLLIYEFLLKKETFFGYNRWYLLITPVIALILPLLKFETLGNMVPSETLVMLPEVIIGATPQPEISQTTSSSSEFQMNWWLAIYFIGFLFATVLFLKKYFDLKRMFGFKVVSEEKTFRIIEIPNSNLACTFFNTIFLGEQLKDNEKQQILSHEMVHVQQKHSLDLLFFELLKLIFWFNPLIYIFQHKIAALHEFIADARVVNSTEKKTYYEQLLNTAFNTENISFINQFFNRSLIKKRIVMLQKSQSKRIAKFKYLLLVPLMLLMLTYVACSEEQFSQDANNLQLGELGEVLTLEVKDVNNLTDAEEAKRNEVMGLLGTEGNVSTLIITDGETSRRIYIDSNPASPPPPPPPASSSSVSPDNTFVPFAVIEEAPVFPGCESLESNEARKECMSTKINEFVSMNFNTGLGKQLGLKGMHRIYVQFKITPSGNIEIMGVRGPEAELEAEARRVVSNLPQMLPGKQDGKKVGVLYSLPISFMVAE